MARKRRYSIDIDTTATTTSADKTIKKATTSSQPRSKLAKEHNISAAQEQEIREAFTLFALPSTHTPFRSSDSSSRHAKKNDRKSKEDPTIHVSNLRRVLTALSLTPTPQELKEYISILDLEGDGIIEYEPFVAVCALKLHSRVLSDVDHEREVDEAWALFVREGDDRITLASLKRVARELGEEISDELLRDMVLEANGGAGLARGVEKGEFEIVMRRAGVWR